MHLVATGALKHVGDTLDTLGEGWLLVGASGRTGAESMQR